MALIKGNKIDQGGSVVVAGDQVIADDATGRSGRLRRRAESPTEPALKLEQVVPPPAALEQVVPAELAPMPGPEAMETAAGGEPPEPPKPDLAQLTALGASTLEAFDSARQEILEAAQAAAGLAAEEEAGAQDPEGTFSALLEGASQRLSEAMAEGAQLKAALDDLVPAIEQQAAATVELEATRAAMRARWREFAGAHEQIAALIEAFEHEGKAASGAAGLLAERERILAEARLQAEHLLEEAHVAAAEVRADAQAQIAEAFEDFERTRQERYEQLVEQARAAGYTEGRAQADEEGAKILEEAIETLNRARLAYPKAVRENSQKLIELAMSVAEKIVCDEVASKPEIVLSVLEDALSRVTDMETVVVRVNPEDLPLVESQEDRFRDMLAQVKKLEFTSSLKIQRGGVFIETGSGTVDATLKTQLSVIQEVFQNVHKELEEIQDVESDAFDDLDHGAR